MADHELYSATAVAKGSLQIQRSFNMASTLNFQEAIPYDATSTYSLMDTVTYTDPDAGILFEGVLIAKKPSGAPGKEFVGWTCQDTALRALAREIWRTSDTSTFRYNIVGLTQTTTVKDVLQDVLSSAVSTLSQIDAYSLPSATTAVIPETTYSGQTYKSVIDDLMRQVPNWAYHAVYGVSGTVTLTVTDMVNGGTNRTVDIGDGSDTVFTTSTESTHVVNLNTQTGADGKFKKLTLEGVGDFTEYYRVSHLQPAWGSATATANRLFSVTNACTDIFTVQDDETGEWKFYRAPVMLYYISGSALLAYTTLDPSEYYQDPYDPYTPGNLILTDFFERAGKTWTSGTAANFRISYTARMDNFSKTLSASSTALDGEKIIQDETWGKYTIVERWNLSATNTVVYNTSATMNAILDDYGAIYLRPNKDGRVVTFQYGDIPYELGDKITNLDNLRVASMQINPDARTITMTLSDDLEALPLNYYARLRNNLTDVQPQTKQKRRFGDREDRRDA